MPKAIRELAASILQSPEHITVHAVASTTDNIKQKVYPVTRNYKRQLLQQLIKRRDLDSVLVFVNTKDESERVFEFVKSAGIPSDYINKNKSQNARQKSLKALKDGNIKVLIATDIASR
jgi:ATP-dependent RNA helicase RhlE